MYISRICINLSFDTIIITFVVTADKFKGVKSNYQDQRFMVAFVFDLQHIIVCEIVEKDKFGVEMMKRATCMDSI